MHRLYAACFLLVFFLAFVQAAVVQGAGGQDVTILQDWRGDYPVSELGRFSDEQNRLPMGYLDSMQQFSNVWQAFKPGEQVPEVDFNNHLVLFVRNAIFYNRLGIAKVLLKDSVAEVMVMETMSAHTIVDKVGMALAVIPRAGVQYIAAGDQIIPVTEGGVGLVSDPLNASYMIEGRQIILQNGSAEEPLVADSATKIRTYVIGKPVEGDLDSDGDSDAVLLLGHDPGGSGMFYYIAAAINQEGQYRGTHATLVGDRIIMNDIAIHNGIVSVNFADRRVGEPMTSVPALEKRIVLTLENDKFSASRPIETDEQIVEGWVTIGHEVRSFKPCSPRGYYWLAGDSPALEEIMVQYRKVLPEANPYTPLFMVLAGKFVEPPHVGFGMDYKGAFGATQLVEVRPDGNCLNDSIVVDAPLPGETITSPLIIRGRARGTWFFEGDFPVFLKDLHGVILARGFVTAKGDWMTKELVDFAGSLKFDAADNLDSAILVLQKDNPSDRIEFDDAMEFFVFMDESKENLE